LIGLLVNLLVDGRYFVCFIDWVLTLLVNLYVVHWVIVCCYWLADGSH